MKKYEILLIVIAVIIFAVLVSMGIPDWLDGPAAGGT
jgi:hypothetical protein